MKKKTIRKLSQTSSKKTLKWAKLALSGLAFGTLLFANPEEAAASTDSYIQARLLEHASINTTRYFYTGYFSIHGGASNTTHRWGRFDDPTPGLQVQSSMYNPVPYNYQANSNIDMYSPVQDWGFTPSNTRWHGSLYHVASGTGAGWQRSAKVDYTRTKTTPVANGVTISGADHTDGNNYWVKQGNSVQARVHGYQNFNGTKWRWEDWVAQNFLRVVGEGKTIRASMDQTGKFESHATSSHVTLSRNAHSRPSGNKDLYSTFNVQGNVDATKYEFETYARSNNGRNHGYVSSKKYLLVDGTIPRHNAPAVYDARYVSGNNHWVRPGDKLRVYTSGYDDGSKIAQTNLRLHGDGNDVRASHKFAEADNRTNEFRSDGGNVSISGGTSPYYGYTAQYTFNVSVNSNAGNKTFAVDTYFIDYVGNAAAYTDSGLRIRTDATAPTITANTSSRDWGSSDVTVSLTHADAQSGIATRQYAWSTSTTTPTSWTNYSSAVTQSSNGTWYLHARAVDNVGRVTTERFGPYRIDKTAPTASLSGNVSAWQNSNVTLSLTASDTGGSGYYRTLLPNGTYSTSATPTFTATSNGTYTFTVYDNAGNSREVSATVNRIDKTAPDGSISGNPTSWQNSNATLTFNATDSGGSGVRRVRIAGGTWVNGSTLTQTVSANGTYSFEVEDHAGNTKTVSTTVNRIDTTDPNGTITGNPTSWQNTNATLTFNATDSGGSGVRRVRVAGGTWVNGSTTSQVATANGTYSFEVEDNAGNTRTVSATVNRIDKSAPTGTISGNPTSWQNTNATLTFNATDSGGSGVRRVRVASGTWVNGSTTSQVATANGTYSFEVEDHAGNTRTVSATVNRIDKSAPTGTISGNPTAWTNSNVTLSLTASDTGGSGYYRTLLPNGTYSTSATPTFTATSNGTYTFTVYDNAGNSREVSATVNRIDKTAPDGSITGNPTSWQNTNATLTFNATDSGGSGVRRVRVAGGTWVNGSTTSQVATANGTYSFEVEDHAGNTRTVSATVNRIDKSAPTGTISGNPTAWTNSNVTLSISTADTGGSNVRRIQRPDGTWVTATSTTHTVSANGTYDFVIEDHAGNTRTVSAVVNRIDKVVPNGAISGNPTSWQNTDAVLTFSATDQGGSGVRRVRVAGGTWVNSSTTTHTATANGTYSFEVEDHAGNTRTVSVTVNRIDKIDPNGTITGNPTAWTNQNATLTLNATDSGGSGVRRVRVAGGTWVNGSTTSQVATANGTYSFEIEDHAGNTRIVTVTVNRIDKTLPTGTISGNPTAWQKNNVTLTLTAADSGGSGYYRTKLPDGSFSTSASPNYTVSTNGTYTFTVYDNAGNSRDVSVTVNRIDKTAPGGSISGNPTSWQNTNATLTFTATDSGGSGVRRVRVAGGTWVNGNTTTQVATANGTYSFEVEDHAGNTTTVSVTVNRIDKTAPDGSIAKSPSSWTNQDVTLTFSPSDAGGSGYHRTRLPDGTFSTAAKPTFVATDNGSYSFTVYDHAGNSKVVTTSLTTIDRVKPAHSSTTVYDARYVNGNDHWFRPGDEFRVKIDGTDSDSQMRYTYIRFTGEGSDNRAQHDWNGSNASAVNEFSKGIYTEITSGSRNGYGNVASYTFNGKVLSDAGNRTLPIQYYFTDKAGNINGYSNTGKRMRLDDTAPTITANTTSRAWGNTNVSVTLTHADSESGIATRQYAWSTSTSTPTSWTNYSSAVTQSSNGTWYLHARAVDNVGRVTTERFGPYRIDKTAPTLSITGNPTNWVGTDVVLTIDAADTGGSGVKEIILPNGNKVTQTSVTYTVPQNSTLIFKVIDHAGNETSYTVIVNRIDKVNPTAIITPSTTNWTNQNVTLTLNAQDVGSGIREIVRPDGSRATSASTTFVATQNGTYTFRVVDNVGNSIITAYTVTNIDKEAPSESSIEINK